LFNFENLKVQIEKSERYKIEIKEIQDQLEIIKKNQEIYSEFRKNIFHQNGVPMFAMKKILPAIEIRASEILTDLTDGQFSQITFREFETVIRVGFDINYNYTVFKTYNMSKINEIPNYFFLIGKL